MDAPLSCEEHPFNGRHDGDHAHAPFEIMRSLVYLGLADWAGTLLGWLGRYDGLERHLSEDFDPSPKLDPGLCVRDVLLQHVALWPGTDCGQRLSPPQRRLRVQAIIADLLALEFIGVRAFWGSGGDRVIWNPLTEDWFSFIQHGCSLPEWAGQDDGQGILHVWLEPLAPEREQAIRALLLGQPCTGDA